jgi:hypothetical protein
VRILDRDLIASGIPKRDGRTRVVDVHALRHTFGTHLSKGGVPLRTAQAAMRHSDPRLTANVCTDPKLLDVAGALDALPALPFNHARNAAHAKATGTDDAAPLVPTADRRSPSEAIPGQTASPNDDDEDADATSASADAVKRKRRRHLLSAAFHKSG